MIRRASVPPPSRLRETERATLPEIISLVQSDTPVRERARSTPGEQIAVVARSASAVVARVAPSGHPSLASYRGLDDVPATIEALVVVIAEDVAERDGDGALRRLRGRAPSAKFVFLTGERDVTKLRTLAMWGAVLPPGADAERLARTLRHAASLSTMAAELRRLKLG